MSKSSVSIGGSVSQSALAANDQNEIRLTPETTSRASRETVPIAARLFGLAR